MEYEWDTAKAARNLRKYGVDFMDAIAAIEDPNRLEDLEQIPDRGEERMRTIGMAGRGVLFVVTTMRGADTCRIISARKATRSEEDQYYTRDSEAW